MEILDLNRRKRRKTATLVNEGVVSVNEEKKQFVWKKKLRMVRMMLVSVVLFENYYKGIDLSFVESEERECAND
jgi:hypothetical protein